MNGTVEHNTFVIERTYAASPARVYRAFADPAQKVRWFGDPDVEKHAGHVIDFRIGGRESMRGEVPGGETTFTYDAVFQDIVEDERIVYSYDMTMNGQRMSVSVATLEFRAAAGGGTRFILTEQGVFLDGLDAGAIREQGTHQVLDGLARFLGEQPA
jgi:uncharacterized protein YndB with AHSA1/START domain